MTNGLDQVAKSTVYDNAGDKVGGVEQIYVSDSTGQPTWASVKTGLFGTSQSLVPLAGAKHTGDHLNVSVSKDAIKNAPHLDAETGISSQQEAELLEHYQLTSATSGWDQYGKHAANDGDATRKTDATGTTDAAGTAGFAGTGTDTRDAAADGRSGVANADDDVIVRSEERLNVGTQREEVGKARLRKYVVSEEQTVTVPVTREEVEIVREPITDPSTVNAKIGDQDAEVILHADRVVTSKESVPVEKVRLAVNEVEEQQSVTDTVRKERIDTDTDGVTTPKR